MRAYLDHIIVDDLVTYNYAVNCQSFQISWLTLTTAA